MDERVGCKGESCQAQKEEGKASLYTRREGVRLLVRTRTAPLTLGVAWVRVRDDSSPDEHSIQVVDEEVDCKGGSCQAKEEGGRASLYTRTGGVRLAGNNAAAMTHTVTANTADRAWIG